MTERFTAYRCQCQSKNCIAWHVFPAAAVRGVCFTAEQAHAVAVLLNMMEHGEFPPGFRVDDSSEEVPQPMTDNYVVSSGSRGRKHIRVDAVVDAVNSLPKVDRARVVAALREREPEVVWMTDPRGRVSAS
jgi:hypothetical protein